jgi:hypothetical protein
MRRDISPATPGSRRGTFILPPAAHARLAALAAREGRSVGNMVQVLLLNGLHLADVPIPSLRPAAQDRWRSSRRPTQRA